jgi:transcriptional regulator with XRE-family HTH domain
MTPDELRAALKELGWSAPHLARLLGVGEKTPTNWELGRAKVPSDVSQWVSVYVYNHRVLVRSAPRAAAGKERGGE